MNEHKAVPNIRFNGFEDVWKSMKFKNILNYERPDKYIVKSDNYSNNGIPVLTANKSFILGYTLESSFYEKPLPIIIFDDFTLDCKLVKFPFKIKSSAIKILSSNNFSDIWFDFYLLKATSFIKEGHARHYISIVQNKKINVPDKQEQQKIGNFFAKLDKLLDLQQQKIDKLELLKKALLQKLFPKHDSKVPELRFKGYDQEWEEKKFSSLYKKCNEKNNLSFGSNKIISVANMYYKKDNVKSDDNYMRTYNIFRLGDIAFEGNKSKKFTFGRFVENTIGDGIVSHVFEVFRPISNGDITYWKYAIHNEDFIAPVLMKSTVKATMMNNLIAKDFLKQQVPVPQLSEQQKIGNLLSKVDQLIELENRKLQNLQQVKKCLLQNMFVE